MTIEQKTNLLTFKSYVCNLMEIPDDVIQKSLIIDEQYPDINYSILLDGLIFNNKITIDKEEEVKQYILKLLQQLKRIIPYNITLDEENGLLNFILISWKQLLYIPEVEINLDNLMFIFLSSYTSKKNTALWYFQNKIFYAWISFKKDFIANKDQVENINKIFLYQKQDLNTYRQYIDYLAQKTALIDEK